MQEADPAFEVKNVVQRLQHDVGPGLKTNIHQHKSMYLETSLILL